MRGLLPGGQRMQLVQRECGAVITDSLRTNIV
jgi:hypothetical protein